VKQDALRDDSIGQQWGGIVQQHDLRLPRGEIGQGSHQAQLPINPIFRAERLVQEHGHIHIAQSVSFSARH